MIGDGSRIASSSAARSSSRPTDSPMSPSRLSARSSAMSRCSSPRVVEVLNSLPVSAAVVEHQYRRVRGRVKVVGIFEHEGARERLT